MLGPIFSVEMITSARRWRQFIVRGVYAIVLLLALWSAYESTIMTSGRVRLGQTANVAANFFYQFTILQLLAVVLVGPALAAGTVAVERERRTIEYLFATDLTNREIVLGKLAAQLVQLGCVVLAGLPVLALAMLMGGISPEHLAVVFLMTLSTLISVTVLAVTVSVWSPRSRDAIMRVYLILFAVLILPELVVRPILSITSIFDWFQPAYEWLASVNPFTTVVKTMWMGMGMARGGGNVDWDPVWHLVAAQGVTTFILATLSTWAVRRVHLRDSGKAPARVRRIANFRRRGPGKHPMLWKELVATRAVGRMGTAGRIALWLIVISVLGLSFYSFLTATGPNALGTNVMTADLFACGLLLLIAGRAGSSITSEREKDTWITLLSTPLTVHEIIIAKMFGTLHAARWLLILLAIVWILPAVQMPELLVGVPFTFVTLGIITLFAVGLGTNYSLRLRNSTRAMGALLATGVFVGGGYLFCCMPMMIGSPSGEIVLAACVPFLLAVPSISIQQRGWNPNNGEILAAYFTGNIFYLIAAVVIIVSMFTSFDRTNDRIPER